MPVLVISGPTASGKSALALAVAKQLNGEIVSADSMQIYRHMNIGTAKPTKEELAQVPHHMVDIAEPNEEYSVSRYSEEAYAKVTDILARGKLPIICGGTGLYINALVKGNTFMGGDEKIRNALSLEYDTIGGQAMLQKLLAVDPDSNHLHANDKKRIVRALEVYEVFGKPISLHNEETKKIPPRLDSVFIVLSPQPTEFLYERIDTRVDQMMEQGLLEETNWLYKHGYLTGTAAQAIGYKELLGYIKGEMPLDSCVALLKQKTRNYAKRQMTWFRAQQNVHFVEYDKKTKFDDVFHITTKFYNNYVIE